MKRAKESRRALRAFTAALFTVMTAAGSAHGATTYTWGVASGSWSAAASWSPARTTPAVDDILVFDGGVTPTASVSSVPNQTFGQLKLVNSVQVTLTSGVAVPGVGTISKSGATVTGVGTTFTTQTILGDIIYGNVTQSTHEVTVITSNIQMTVTLGTNFASQAWSIAPKLMPSGGPGDDFIIGPGSKLTIASSVPPISIYLLAGATGQIAGALTFAGNIHRLHAANSGAIVVSSGGVITADTGYLGNPFTVVGPTNIITFQSGSIFVGNAGANPFALAQPASKVVFQTGSLYRFQAPNAASLSGRTYADLEFNTSIVSAASGGTSFIVDNLNIISGGIQLAGSLGAVIKGNLSVGTLGVFDVTPGAPSTPINFSGTSPQTISGPGSLTFNNFSAVFMNNPTSVALARNVTMDGVLTLTAGRVVTGANVLRLGTTGFLGAGPGWVDGNLQRAVPASGGAQSVSFPVGDATTAAGVKVDFSSVSNAGDLTATTVPGDHPNLAASGLAIARSVNRVWTLNDGAGLTFPSCDVTLNFAPSDVDGGTNLSTVLVGKYDGAWVLPAVSARTSTSTKATGISSFSDFVVAELQGDRISPLSPASCISSVNPCVAVPVYWDRNDVTPARGYSVKVQLSANLSLCGVQFASGGYLPPGSGGTSFLVTPSGPNEWIVDEATLGAPCGATGDGTLFTAYVTSTDPGGTGTVSVQSAVARDCSNAPVPAVPGDPVTITIDNVVPASITLSAAQKLTGNLPPGSSTTDVTVTLSTPEAGSSVAVYRKGFGGYPQYDENGGAVPTQPATPAAAAGSGWTLTGVTSSPGNDRTATRDFYYYVAFVTDACGNVSGPSALTAGTLNYHLGDVHDGVTSCAGNDLVNTGDISSLGANYGVTILVNGALECLDIGPTTDNSVNARPTTDNVTDFEDLILYAINYNQVSAPQAKAPPAGAARTGLVAAASDELRLAVPTLPAIGETFAVGLELSGTGIVQGFSAEMAYDAAVVAPIGVERGDLLSQQSAPGVVLSARPGSVDVALLGARAGLVGTGEVARVRFRVRAAGDPAIRLAHAQGRDTENHPIVLEGGAPPPTSELPRNTGLALSRPSPFRDRTTLEYSLANSGPVQLSIYSIDGRRVRTLLAGPSGPGVFRIAWDGRDEGSHAMPAGMYYARLVTNEGRFTRSIVKLH